MRALAVLALLVGCGGSDDPPDTLIYPADYAATYVEVRDCRFSTDHDSQRIRVLADPASVQTYNTRTGTFATGAILVKEQYATADSTCLGPIQQITAMRRLDTGAGPDTLDWEWQRVVNGHDETEDVTRCVSCHTDCGVPPVGFEGTCTMP